MVWTPAEWGLRLQLRAASLGLVEGLNNNKSRVLQRRAYGYRDEDYLKLKIVAAFLPHFPPSAERALI